MDVFEEMGGVTHWLLEVLRQALAGNLLQDSDMLLLLSQVVHLTPCNCTPLLLSGTCEQGVESVLHLKWFW